MIIIVVVVFVGIMFLLAASIFCVYFFMSFFTFGFCLTLTVFILLLACLLFYILCFMFSERTVSTIW